MNVKEYIASGIVESYVLGLASKEDMAEFERMAAAHHEVRLAREAFEKQMEEQSLANGIKPPPSLKSKIFAELEIEADKLKTNGESVMASPEESAEARPATVSMRWWRYAAAASIILLLGSAALNIYYVNQVKTYKNLYLTAQTEFANKEKALEAQMTAYQHSMNIIRDTNMAVVRMKGLPSYPESMATVYWDKRSKDVFLLVNNLPRPAAGKQYQLWAIVNGQPVDAGMLNWNDDGSLAVMKNIPTAQAFAITLEKEGGSPTPTANAMYVHGTL